MRLTDTAQPGTAFVVPSPSGEGMLSITCLWLGLALKKVLNLVEQVAPTNACALSSRGRPEPR